MIFHENRFIGAVVASVAVSFAALRLGIAHPLVPLIGAAVGWIYTVIVGPVFEFEDEGE